MKAGRNYGQKDGGMDGQMDDPNAICPSVCKIRGIETQDDVDKHSEFSIYFRFQNVFFNNDLW